MQAMRDLLRTSLGKSLSALSPLDRLAAAWPIAVGHGIAERSEVTSLEDGAVTITVADPGWQMQLRSTAGLLQNDLARISRVPLTAILFVLPSVQTTDRKPAASIAQKPVKIRKA
jgi:predicted nucleic acid-binding Zn ribbon protein